MIDSRVNHGSRPVGLPRISAAAIAVAVLATGCGGSGKSYDSSAIADCLRDKNVSVSRGDADAIAQSANGFYVRSSSDLISFSANVAFGDPVKLKQTYEQIGPGRIETHGNALVIWDDYSDTGHTIIADCFR